MSHQTEPSANTVLGALLQRMLPGARVRSENTQVIAGYAGRQPDVLITAPGRSPVVIEAEYLPAFMVRDDAQQRLGLEVVDDPRPIEAVIALPLSRSRQQNRRPDRGLARSAAFLLRPHGKQTASHSRTASRIPAG